ncbi:hypothetical protein PoHVEF18_004295 [Penicillium ochrochloron]
MSSQADVQMAVSTCLSAESSEQGENPSVACPAGMTAEQPSDPLGEEEMIQPPANCGFPDSSAGDQRGRQKLFDRGFDGSFDGATRAAQGKKNKRQASDASSSRYNKKRMVSFDGDDKYDGYDSDDGTFDPKAKQKPNANKDTHGDPMLDSFHSTAEINILTAERKRHVDWRNTPRALRTGNHRRAAYVQQAGMLAPKGEACNRCGSQNGPFESCRVLVTGGDVVFSGACGNCSFSSASIRCSLRADDDLPEWIKEELAKQNPSHPLLKDGKERTLASESSRRGLSSEEPQTPTPKTGGLQGKGKFIGKGASASKEKGQAKRKAADNETKVGPYETQWMKSPVGDLQVQQSPALALAAYNLLPEMIARLQSDQEILRKYLLDEGLLKDDEDEDEKHKNPFLKFI